MKKKACYVIIVSRTFPATHPRKGEETNFISNIGKNKKHTIRLNYELWKKRIDKVNRDEAYISLRYWSKSPYNYDRDGSKQVEVRQYHKGEIGIQKLDLTKLGYFIDDVDNDVATEQLVVGS